MTISNPEIHLKIQRQIGKARIQNVIENEHEQIHLFHMEIQYFTLK
jgi:hypothetical protein